MKSFDVYRHPTQEGYQVVKQGFGWPAFFFGAIWAFVKKMWGLGFALLGINIVLYYFQAGFEEEGSVAGVLLMLLASMMVWIVVGVKGNDWRRRTLFQRGFEKVDTVNAATLDAAITSFEQSRDGIPSD